MANPSACSARRWVDHHHHNHQKNQRDPFGLLPLVFQTRTLKLIVPRQLPSTVHPLATALQSEHFCVSMDALNYLPTVYLLRDAGNCARALSLIRSTNLTNLPIRPDSPLQNTNSAITRRTDRLTDDADNGDHLDNHYMDDDDHGWLIGSQRDRRQTETRRRIGERRSRNEMEGTRGEGDEEADEGDREFQEQMARYFGDEALSIQEGEDYPDGARAMDPITGEVEHAPEDVA